MKTRPYRIFKKKGKQGRYIKRDGKKVHIKTYKKMTDKGLINVMIKNVVGHRAVRTREKGNNATLSYQKKVGLDEMKNKLATAKAEKEKDTNDIVKYKKVIKKLEEVEATRKPVQAKVMESSSSQPQDKEHKDDDVAERWRIHGATNARKRRIINALGSEEAMNTYTGSPESLRDIVLTHELEGNTDIRRRTHWREDPDIRHPPRQNPEGPDIIEPREERREQRDDGGEESRNEHGGGTINIGKDGMNTTQIESFLDKRTHHFIPCIARDEMDTLLPYVNKGTKEFGFVFNSQNKNQSGQHWRACYINKDSGECDFFDSLVSEPDTVFMKGITKLIEKLEPDIYLKFKINRVKLQSNTSSNCGEFCCQFLDKMFHGGKFRQATFYDSINGEKSVKKYRSKWGLL